MKINLKRLDDHMHFQCTNKNGHNIELSNGEKSVGPMESVLMAIAGCSSIDVVSILGKMKLNLKDIQVEVNGERATDQVAAVFTKINVHYKLYGDIPEDKAARALELTFTKYCSVSIMLQKAAEINYTFEIIDELMN